MRKIFLFMMVTADGYFEGPDHDISWHNVDNEFVEFAVKQLDETDTLIFGRRTYELMAEFWPSPEAIKEDPETAKRMNAYHKLVFSPSLKTADWNNTELHSGNVAEIINQLKQLPGKDIAVLASSNLCLTLIKEGLLDEVRLMINPVAIGKGTSLFTGLEQRLKMELVANRQFKSGNVLLTYTLK